MQIIKLMLEIGGIVLLAPDGLRARYGGEIAEGTNLLERYTTADEGDEVVKAGLVIPILNIEPWDYTVHIRLCSEESRMDGTIIVENGVFPLVVEKRLGIWDAWALRIWREDDWEPVEVPPGIYAVTVRGWRRMTKDGTLNKDGDNIEEVGYEFVLEPRDKLPELTADFTKDMRVLWWGPNGTPGAPW